MCIVNILIWLAIGAGILWAFYSIHNTRQKARMKAREETFRKKTEVPKKPSDLLYEAIINWISTESPRKAYTVTRKKTGWSNQEYHMSGKITIQIDTAAGSKITIPTSELVHVQMDNNKFFYVEDHEIDVHVYRDEKEILFTESQREKIGREVLRLFKRSHEAVKAETLAANEVVCAEVLNDMNLNPGAV